MNALHGVVLVLRAGTPDVDRVPSAFADLVGPEGHRSDEGLHFDVPGLAGGTLSQRRHPAGVDLLTVTYLAGDDGGPGAEAVRIRTELLVRGARDLRARFGFVTRDPGHRDDPLLTTSTVRRFLDHDWAGLRAAPHEAWLFTAERPDPLIGRHLASGPWGALLGAANDGEPPHRILIPPPGWAVQFTHLRHQEPDDLGPDDDWYWFFEDIAYFRHDTGAGVDIGWYPDQDPAGRYQVAHVDAAWKPLSPRYETRCLAEVVAHVERLWGLVPS